MEAYMHWYHRLSLIAEAFDVAGPSTFRQWWYDRRKMERWWGFWLLVIGVFLAVVFGLIPSVKGILQVLKD
ncbi:putative dihydroorotase [Apiospora marii]|uniref:Dihydroorotase n=1 Tax=Apiospora marii TaxID=335849 RepID=A0ABR1RLQ0_9PEZI